MIGQTLGHYEVTGSLGKGGMGEVWRARDTKLGREVAIKTLPRDLAQDADRLIRFEREAKALAALNHANIAAVYGLDEHDGTRFVAMELVEGETLAKRLEGGALPVEDALRLGLQIAQALEAAHEKGIVHRDLKPANVMVTRDGQIKVLDFGLAKAFAGDPNAATPAHSPALSLAMTQQGLILGTAAYMSPEQASGQATDQRADVWAFGIVLFEMLTGLPVFTGESVPHILAGILRTDPDWNRLPKNLHPRLRLLLERCLEKKPRDRYHSIADARVDIEKILADPTGAKHSFAAPAAQAAAPRWPWLAGGLAAAVVGATLAWMLKPAAVVAPPPVVRFDFALNEGQTMRNPGRDVIAISPDGTQIVYNANDGLYLRAVGETEARRIPGTEQVLTNPFFSPDGEWIGFWDAPASQLKKIRTAGGSAVVLTGAGNPQGASWHPDGSKIVYGQPEGLFEISANGGTPTLLIPASGPLWDPQYLPNGAILFWRATGPTTGDIVAQVPGQDAHVLFPGERAIYVPTGHLIVTDPAAAPTALFARTFDLNTFEVGGPVPVAENATVRNNKTHYAVAVGGTLAYVYGSDLGSAVVLPDLALAVVSRDGTRRSLGAPLRPYRNPRVSPDGTRVAVEILDADGGGGSIWIYDLAGDTDIRRLTQVNEGTNLRPLWTLDGARIAFASDRDGPSSIYWQDADGRGPAERLTTADEDTFHLPESWAPDGTLSFAVVNSSLGAGAGGWGLYTRSPDGESSVFYDLEGTNQWSSAFSPDGRWLAYTSVEEPSNGGVDFRVFVERYPKTGERYELAVDGALNPIWSRDGTEIFYRRGITNAPRVLNSVKILATEPRFRFTTASSVAIEGFLNHQNYRDFDLLPDGSGWIMLLPADAEGALAATPAQPPAPDRIYVVLNWFEELKRRAPN
ncbi:MAG TPA: protein kinase [Gammaproteobacteria bacterium]